MIAAFCGLLRLIARPGAGAGNEGEAGQGQAMAREERDKAVETPLFNRDKAVETPVFNRDKAVETPLFNCLSCPYLFAVLQERGTKERRGRATKWREGSGEERERRGEAGKRERGGGERGRRKTCVSPDTQNFLTCVHPTLHRIYIYIYYSIYIYIYYTVMYIFRILSGGHARILSGWCTRARLPDLPCRRSDARRPQGTQ